MGKRNPDDEQHATEDVIDEKKAAPRRRLITRRRVLIGSGSTLAACALGLGGYVGYSFHRRFNREATSEIPDHRVKLPAAQPKMVIARGPNPALNARAAIEHLGGIRQFITADDVVLVKPNIGWARTPAQAANTHPEVVAEVVRLCAEVGPKRLIVSDCPVNEARKSFEMSGILRAASEAGAEVILPEESRFHQVQISPRLGTWDVLEPFVIASKIINVPVGKHHNLTGVTAGMKNWIGITSKLRMQFHGDINRSIAELAALMRPTLTVLDATRVLMAGGPQGGSLRDVNTMNTVAAGVDPVALDAWAFHLFGSDPQRLSESLLLAEEMGLGKADFRALSPVEIVTG
jgi:uncharacterized protein (DUF362 family)